MVKKRCILIDGVIKNKKVMGSETSRVAKGDDVDGSERIEEGLDICENNEDCDEAIEERRRNLKIVVMNINVKIFLYIR